MTPRGWNGPFLECAFTYDEAVVMKELLSFCLENETLPHSIDAKVAKETMEGMWGQFTKTVRYRKA